MLHKTPFPHRYQQWAFTLSEFILRPVLLSFSEIVSIFIPTTAEQNHRVKHYLQNLPLLPLYLSILICLLVPSIVAFFLRCLLHLYRNSYILSVRLKNGQTYATSTHHQKGHRYNISTMNICLLPEFLSRFNNLSHTSWRARSVGQRIIADQIQSTVNPKALSLKGNILTNFPEMDFICIQEAWHRDYSKTLVNELHKIYPWIVYDVGNSNLYNNYFIFNSGLMFVSKYEILHAGFKTYSHSCKQCLFSGKGLLMIKVLIEKTTKGTKVGYIFNTHLQAYQGETPIIQKQLDEVKLWTEEFRTMTRGHGDIVTFDILCGDFNFDNISPGDQCLAEHEIFNIYVDPARKTVGKDQDWAVGTEMRQSCVWERDVSTAEKFKLSLENPVKRRRYILDADVEVASLSSLVYDAHPKTGEINKECDGKRRIDYVLYNKDVDLKIEQYAFVTRLAQLTDHVPVTMTISTL